MKPAKRLTDKPIPGEARRVLVKDQKGLTVQYCCFRCNSVQYFVGRGRKNADRLASSRGWRMRKVKATNGLTVSAYLCGSCAHPKDNKRPLAVGEMRIAK